MRPEVKVHFDRYGGQTVMIHEPSVIGKDVSFGKNVTVGPFCLIEDNMEIGDEVTIPAYSHVQKDKKVRGKDK